MLGNGCTYEGKNTFEGVSAVALVRLKGVVISAMCGGATVDAVC